ncbi:aldo/keto reductase [Glutamicibacter sp. 287]|uniref:aldo/keto reductase n=1 Tax=unclassified Glutamicibacter TaxID=2627139 RepID=UPI000BB7B9DD|nr:aldo/keto reductase [Glutamicibacter sp. BW80]PCC27100.1 aldo/keto reductase [Glutamicibacter sp. BW80]
MEYELVNPHPDSHRPYVAAASRYENFGYRRVGDSGLVLPPLSLGLWWNFGDNRPFATQREVLRHAFDHGINHFDLANNYGPPAGSAEENFGRMMRKDFMPYRDELIISSKAGYEMWAGPFGTYGSRKYLLASAEASLKAMNLDYVDIFYSHRYDPKTPLEETIGALDTLVRQGKASYVGISSYSAERTAQAKAIAVELGTPLVIHQPSYNILNPWVEHGLLATLEKEDMGAIAFTPLAQGLLTDKYLNGTEVQRQGGRRSLEAQLTDENLTKIHKLNDIAQRRGQSLAQMSLAWLLREGAATSVLIGASSTKQLDENLGALNNLQFTESELKEISEIAQGDAGIDWWKNSAIS